MLTNVSIKNYVFSYLEALLLQRKILGIFFLICIFTYFITQTERTSIEVKLQSQSKGTFQIYWANVNQNYSEPNSSVIKINKQETDYVLNIPNLRSVRKLRIDPLNEPSKITIKSIVIKQIGFQSIRFNNQKELKKLIPLNDIAKVDYSADGMNIVTSGSDPMLEVTINPLAESSFQSLLRYVTEFFFKILLSIFISVGAIISIDLINRAIHALVRFHANYLGGQTFLKRKQNNILKSDKLIRILLTSFFTVCFIFLVKNFIDEFYDRNIFGSSTAPYSDALFWLRGTVDYINDLPFKTYRPTVNLFFSSIYSAFSRIDSIPMFSIVFFGINISLLYFLSSKHVKIYLTIMLLIFLLFFNQLLDPLNIGQLMIDFLPFIFTILGTFFIGYALRNSDIHFDLLYSGLFILGVATAVRGVQLIAGFIIIIIAMVMNWKRAKKINVLFVPIIFLAPMVFDMFLQKKFGSINNGLLSFFCFYSDHHHFWTRKCGDLYKSLNPSHIEVLRDYFNYLFTEEGLSVFYSFFQDMSDASLSILQSKLYMIVLILSTILFTLNNYRIEIASRLKYFYFRYIKKELGDFPPSKNLAFDFFLIKILVHLFFIPLLVWLFPNYAAIIFYVYLSCLFVITAILGQTFTMICLSLYMGGVLLFTMLGMPGNERVASSFAFTLPLGYLLFIIEEERMIELPMPKRLNLILVFNIVVLIFLYAGNLIFPIGNGFNLKKKTVIKLSDDSRIDRSLYYSQEGALFYTRHDQYTIGAVRSFSEIACPHGIFNASYKRPCTIK